MIIISLCFSAVILFFSDFKGTGSFKGGSYGMMVHLVISYVCALVISLLLLWFFGRTRDLGWSVIIAETVVLAIPGSLGASAGRMLIG
ncbi:DUF2391 family protein [Salinimicrobium terrae]|uniref:DUF2391 family protein n=1 Tax=Salinimicrobium terrae TaxID=470866 RepID=UPI000684F56E|nr:DUF2391 family protein [Salinimicrobium terrae]